jgi:hypothetical protein
VCWVGRAREEAVEGAGTGCEGLYWSRAQQWEKAGRNAGKSDEAAGEGEASSLGGAVRKDAQMTDESLEEAVADVGAYPSWDEQQGRRMKDATDR